MEKSYITPQIEIIDAQVEQQMLVVSNDIINIDGVASGNDALAPSDLDILLPEDF